MSYHLRQYQISISSNFQSLHTEILASHTFQLIYLSSSCDLCRSAAINNIIHSPSNYHYCFKSEDTCNCRQPSSHTKQSKTAFSNISFYDNQRMSFQSKTFFPAKLRRPFKLLPWSLEGKEPWTDNILFLCFLLLQHDFHSFKCLPQTNLH